MKNDRIVSALRNVLSAIESADCVVADCCQPFCGEHATTSEITAAHMQGLLAHAKTAVMTAIGHRIHEIMEDDRG